jgi:hypothetical protein
VRFLIDAQLPPALARMLTEHGHIAEHVNGVGPGNAADLSVWTYAIDQSTVLVTKDEDVRDTLSISLQAAPSPNCRRSKRSRPCRGGGSSLLHHTLSAALGTLETG